MATSQSLQRSQAPSSVSQAGRILILSTFCSVAVSIAAWQYLNSANDCRPPPEGFECVYCGPQLTAIRSKLNPSIFAVLATQTDDSDGLVVQSYLDLKHRISRSPYIERILQILKKFGRRNILLLGLGGGSVPALAITRIRDCKLTAVDISPDSLRIVRQFVQPDDGVHVRYVQQSAEEFLKSKRSEQFDVVIEDMYDDADVPGFIYDREYMQNIHRVLNIDGMFISNVFMPEGHKDRVTRSLGTINSFFYEFGVSELGRNGNVILVASKIAKNLKTLTDMSLKAREIGDEREYDILIQNGRNEP